MRSFLWSFSVLLLLLVGCSPEPATPPLPLSAAETSVRNALDTIWADYATLHLPRALARARRLNASLGSQDNVRGTLRAEVWQSLAILHFHHFTYLDSVPYFTHRAGPQVKSNHPAALQARQLLCKSYAAFHTWSWLDMQMHAQFGRQLLERAGQDTGLLYPQLQLMEARGAKQVADRTAPPEKQRAFYRRSELLFEECVARLSAQSSPWAGYAVQHLIILLSRLPEQEERLRRLADGLVERGIPRGGVDAPAYFGFHDRALGYWHARRGRTDSAVYYAERTVAQLPLFSYEQVYGPLYVLQEHGNATRAYAQAVDYLLANIALRGCCPPKADPATEADLFSCTLQPNCPYFWSSLARTYQSWGRWADEPRHVDRAFRYAQAALDYYEGLLVGQSEEGTLNSTVELGDRLITVALEAATTRLERQPTDRATYDALLRTVELSKSVLYNRDLLAVSELVTAEAQDPDAQRLRQVEAELKLLKASFAGQLTLPYPALRRYDELHEEAYRLTQPQRVNVPAVARGPVAPPKVAEVRTELTADQALLAFAETDGQLYALYIDHDTLLTSVRAKNPIGEGVSELVHLLSDRASPDRRQYAVLAQQLYGALLGPFTRALDRRSELLIVPTVSLGELPFAALIRPTVPPETSRYLVQTHRIRYLDSWRSERQRRRLRTASPARPGPPRIGAWTHPDLTAYLAPLATEVLPIAAGGGKHYSGGACTSQSLLDDLHRYDWLHLAVHARGNPAQLNANYLYLNRQDSLNGLHISQRVLRAQLVVLAACSTSRGYGSRREGTYSLRRSFHRAGVPDVVASLYDIPAAATAALLRQFYAELLRGAEPTEALTLAQRRALRGELGARWGWPGYWAGVVVG